MKNSKQHPPSVFGYIKAHPFKVVFVILWALFVYKVIMAGYTPDPFSLRYADSSDPKKYPIDLVINMSAVMLFHITVLWVVDYYINSRWKFLLMLAITLLLLSYYIIFIIHASPPLANLVFWLLISFTYLLLTCIWQVCRYFIIRLNIKKQKASAE